MEIHINGQPVAKVSGLSRSVTVQSDGGEVTNFDISPGVRTINLVVEQAVAANSPRLDEIELLRYIEAQEEGLLDGDGKTGGTDSIKVESISGSEFTSDEEETTENDENKSNEGNIPKFNVGATS